MRKIPLIGITGRARSGKDTVADFIVSQTGGYKYSFADPLKQMLLPLGIDMSTPYWQERKEQETVFGVSPRRLMQTLGTEWGRNLIHPDLWLLLADQKITQCGENMVVTDVRFENEAAWVRWYGGVVIHVVRPDATPVEQHISEAGINNHIDDMSICNDGTLEELKTNVLLLLQMIKYGQ
jgi:hypothetical protein